MSSVLLCYSKRTFVSFFIVKRPTGAIATRARGVLIGMKLKTCNLSI